VHSVLKSLLPSYNSTDRNRRVEMKRCVKNYLLAHLGDAFSTCILPSEDGTTHTYGIPKTMEPAFREWASVEIRRIFG
jgi:hypothetical protein